MAKWAELEAVLSQVAPFFLTASQAPAENGSSWIGVAAVEDPGGVPNYMMKSVWWVMWLTVVEYLALWLQGARLPVLHDNVVSLLHATLFEVTKVFVRGLEYGTYTWVWQHYALLPSLGNSLLAMVTLVTVIDLIYYWLHRANHEIMVLWAIHQVHHSSQNLTVTVGLRHSPLQRLFSWVFYVPLAVLGVHPAHMLAHAQFNTIFQCWIHTHAIRTIGPLQYVFNSPAHHRVHHGSNLYCLDKNYGGILILWDRLFGTFQEELPDQEIVYGILTQPDSYNPLYHQVFYLKLAMEKAWAMGSWREGLCSLVKGPSWTPGSPWTGWDKDKPNISVSREYRRVRATTLTHCYVILHFLAALTLTGHLTVRTSGSPMEAFVYGTVVVAGLAAMGMVYDGSPYTRLVELTRCSSGLLLCLLLPSPVSSFLPYLATLYALSLPLWCLGPATVLGHPGYNNLNAATCKK
nr:alkylglycerol monooxygenase-like [Procambarus clarkii]